MGKTGIRFRENVATERGNASERVGRKSTDKLNRSALSKAAPSTISSAEKNRDADFECSQPIYLNEKFGLSYPLLPKGASCKNEGCPVNEEFLKRLTRTNLSGNVGDSKSIASRALRRLDEKLNSGFYGYLKKFETENVAMKSSDEPFCPCEGENYPRQMTCACGSDCPVKNENRKDEVRRTFHVPTCPEATPVQQPKCPVEGLKICPYSPEPCPLGMKCPFPVDSVYDPAEPMPPPPPCPAVQGNRCPLAAPAASKFEAGCPLEPIKPLPHLNASSMTLQPACPLAQKPPLCPLSTPPAKACPLQSEADCPLLNCSLGPLKNWIFSDGDPCPFCKRPCCPLVTPEGPGCPILKPALLCPMADEGGDCALANQQCPPVGPQCPIGLLLDKRKREAEGACPCGPQPRYNLEKSCPMSGALECPALSNSANPVAGSKPGNCPFPDPVACPLAPPKCPLGPPEPACPLAREVNCPLQGGGGSTGGLSQLMNADKVACPVEYPPCDLFPEGRCPQKDLNLCECEYPVSPCLEPLLCGDEPAKEQYCTKRDCCMGLPWPPLTPGSGGKFDTGTWFKFQDRIPGFELTKHYVEILDHPPEPEYFNGRTAREHDNWKVVEAGKGYMQCETVKELIDKRGPMANAFTQFDPRDNPLDPETKLVMDNREAMAKTIKDMQRRANISEWKD